MYKLFFVLLFLSSGLLAQNSVGYCRTTKVSPDPCKNAKITIKFLNPQGKPAKSNVNFKMNDSLVQPKLSESGTYEMLVRPGTYNFNFFVKFWHDVNSKPLKVKAKTNTNLLVKFEAKEIGSSPVKQ